MRHLRAGSEIAIATIVVAMGVAGMWAALLVAGPSAQEMVQATRALPAAANADTTQPVQSPSATTRVGTATPTAIASPPTYAIPSDEDLTAVIAEVEIAQIYDLRSNTESGVVPTRDPALAFGEWRPTEDRRLWLPLRLDILATYKTDVPGSDGILLAVPAGYAADFQIQKIYDWVDPDRLRVGDRALVLLDRNGSSLMAAVLPYLDSLASKLRAPRRDYATGYRVLDWYYIEGNMAVSHSDVSGSAVQLSELSKRLHELGQ